MEYDFDYWKRLAEEQPEEYERVADAYVNKYIENHFKGDEVKINRMKGVYWRAKQEVRNIKNPVVRADRANTIMWNEFRKLNALMQQLFGDNK